MVRAYVTSSTPPLTPPRWSDHDRNLIRWLPTSSSPQLHFNLRHPRSTPQTQIPKYFVKWDCVSSIFSRFPNLIGDLDLFRCRLQSKYCVNIKRGVSTTKDDVYSAYQSLCEADGRAPLARATFGKMVHLAFPGLTSNRVGQRGTTTDPINAACHALR